VTTIELEHTDKPGDTLAAIAAEKAGIGEPVAGRGASRPGGSGRWRCARGRRARARSGPGFGAGSQGDLDGLSLQLRDGNFAVDATLPLLGVHHAANAALAVACVRALGTHGEAALADAVRRGFASAVLPGRVEVLSRAPWIIVDAAHTAASARGALPQRSRRAARDASRALDLGGQGPRGDPRRVAAPRIGHRCAPSRRVRSILRRSLPRRARRDRGFALRAVPNPHLPAPRAKRRRLMDCPWQPAWLPGRDCAPALARAANG
jgi:hypothetical protein